MNNSGTDYIFTSMRLGFRNWTDADIEIMAEANADEAVMEYFPSVQTYEQTEAMVKRLQDMYARAGFCYFAVDVLDTAGFIGFIGIAEQHFEADFTPCIDIGWRLHKKAWNKGYATEGAKACLEYAFEKLQLQKIYAMAPVVNIKSIEVMKKIGMQKVSVFQHPLLLNDPRLVDCILYEINNQSNSRL